MAKTVQIQEFGGADKMQLVDLPVGDPGPGQIRIRHEAIDELRNYKIEDGITEKFETLIALPRRTTVRQCLLQQVCVIETVFEMTLGPIEPSHQRRISIC